MPEQDNWKERLEQWKEHFYWYVGLADGFKHSKKEMVDEIELILSSQAHALKEQMKSCVPEAKEKPSLGMTWDYKDYQDEGFNYCRNQTLSAIESIEI